MELATVHISCVSYATGWCHDENTSFYLVNQRSKTNWISNVTQTQSKRWIHHGADYRRYRSKNNHVLVFAMSGLHQAAFPFCSLDSKNSPAISQSSGKGGRSRAAKRTEMKRLQFPPTKRRNRHTFYHRERGQHRSTISKTGTPRSSLQLKWDCGLNSDPFRSPWLYDRHILFVYTWLPRDTYDISTTISPRI